MSIIDTVQQIESDLKSAYAIVNDKGGTLPANQNTANLSGAIRSIPANEQDELGQHVSILTIRYLDDNNSPTGECAKIYDCALPEYGSSLPSACLSALGRQTIQPTITSYRLPAIAKCHFDSFIIKGAIDLATNGVCGGNSETNGFINVKIVDLSECQPLDGATLCVGRYFCAYAKNLKTIKLPLVGCDCDNTYFMHGCDNFVGPFYIPEYTNPPTDDASLAATRAETPMYTQGITLTGPGAAAWKEALPDLDGEGGFYRKLVVG